MLTHASFYSHIEFVTLTLLPEMVFNIGGLAILLIVLIVLYRIRITRLKDQKASFAQRATTQSELLAYAIENETKAREEAKIAIQAKRDLLARISREVRSPMNGVIGMTSLLKETLLTAEQREYCETIKNCGESLLTAMNDILFEDVLAHAKVEPGKIPLEKDFDLRNSIEEVLDVFATKASQVGVELVYKVDHHTPSTIVTYSLWVRQILMNLVENAFRFTQKGEILVNVKSQKNADGNTFELVFEVSDTGIGISADRMKVLTDRLSDAGNATRSQEERGVGLLLCKKLVLLMGGDICIESILNQGTTVRFSLQARAGVPSLRDHILREMKGKKILIIDDNAHTLEALRSQIEEWKLLPVIASSGQQALEILMKASDINLVITDMAMPEMDGVSTARAIRRGHPVLPIILLSGEGDVSFTKYPGLFNSVVPKPIKQHILSEQIFSNLKHLGETATSKEQFAKQKLSLEFARQYPLRILIAEDDRVNQKLIIRILSKLGYNADIAQNGKEVLEIVSQVSYDVVFMDVQMPEMDGLEATRMIRLCLTTQPIIIAMTVNVMQGDREDCIQAGMDDYISKPVNIEELVILLEKAALQMKIKS